MPAVRSSTVFFALALAAVLAGCTCGEKPQTIPIETQDLCKLANTTACETTAQCGERHICKDAKDQMGKDLGAKCCVRSARRCADDTGCCPGQVCSGADQGVLGTCVDKFDECSTNEECGELGDRVCEAWDDPALGSTMRCTYKRCTGLGDCPGGQSCFNSFCVAQPPCGGSCPSGEACVPQNNRCHPYGDRCQVSCKPGFLAVFKNVDAVYDTCQMEQVECHCAELPPIASTDLGRHASIASAGGRIFVPHYDGEYGDLVLTEFDATGAKLKSSWLDGVPADGQVIGGPSGARGGIQDPGDNVGKYTSIAAGADGTLHIAYYDETRGDLRYIQRSPSGAVSAPIRVDGADADTGLYTSLALDPTGNPVIAYFQRAGSDTSAACAAAPGAAKTLITALRLAKASNTTPFAPSDWTFETVSCAARPPPPCFGCETAGTKVCVDNGAGGTQCLTPSASCAPGCGSGEVCVSNSGSKCMAQGNPIELADIPPGSGLFPSLAFKGAATVIAWYDGTNGNLMVSEKTGSTWKNVVLDGNDASGDTGNVGLFPSLVIDASGKYNVAYHDFSRRMLRFYSNSTLSPVSSQGAPGAASIIDNGLVDANLDGPSYVGADAALVFGGTGTFVAYQNSTAVDLRLAKREPSGWKVVKEWTKGGVGFFADAVEMNGKLYIVHTRIQAKTVEGRPTADNALLLEVVEP